MKILKIISIILLIVLGAVTLFMGSSVLFDWFGIRAKEGNYVEFVVWANWLCSFLYLASAYKLLKSQNGATRLLIGAVIILLIALIGFAIHIKSGGLYETKTVYAMIFRTVITLILARISFSIEKNY